MKVKIKDFGVVMQVKNTGIELDVANPQGVHIGDLIVTRAKLIWCEGRTGRARGKKVTWKQFIAYMQGR